MKTRFTFLFLMISMLGFSQANDTIFLWKSKVQVGKEINPSNKTGSYEGISQVTNPLMLVFRPKDADDRKAAVIVCPGGGFTHLSIAKEGYEIATWLNSLGITAFVLEYSVPDKRAQAFQDIQRAVKIVRSRSAEWGLNPQKLGVIGFSAGGGLCARVSSCIPEKMDYKPVDLADSVSCIPNFALLIYSGGLGREADSGLPTELSFGKGTPPMFVFGTADDMVTNYGSLYLTKELYRSKVPVELHILPEGGHGYGLRTGNTAGRAWPALAESWLFRNIF